MPGQSKFCNMDDFEWEAADAASLGMNAAMGMMDPFSAGFSIFMTGETSPRPPDEKQEKASLPTAGDPDDPGAAPVSQDGAFRKSQAARKDIMSLEPPKPRQWWTE